MPIVHSGVVHLVGIRQHIGLLQGGFFDLG